jgi:uncharacterized membrane protein
MSSPKQSYFSQNTLGAIAYLAVIPAILLLLIPRSKKNPYVRFHAWQAIEIAVGTVFITYALTLTIVRGPFVSLGLSYMALGGIFLTCWFCGVMALRGTSIRLPLIGAWAEALTNSTPRALRVASQPLVSNPTRQALQ